MEKVLTENPQTEFKLSPRTPFLPCLSVLIPPVQLALHSGPLLE